MISSHLILLKIVGFLMSIYCDIWRKTWFPNVCDFTIFVYISFQLFEIIALCYLLQKKKSLEDFYKRTLAIDKKCSKNRIGAGIMSTTTPYLAMAPFSEWWKG